MLKNLISGKDAMLEQRAMLATALTKVLQTDYLDIANTPSEVKINSKVDKAVDAAEAESAQSGRDAGGVISKRKGGGLRVDKATYLTGGLNTIEIRDNVYREQDKPLADYHSHAVGFENSRELGPSGIDIANIVYDSKNSNPTFGGRLTRDQAGYTYLTLHTQNTESVDATLVPGQFQEKQNGFYAQYINQGDSKTTAHEKAVTQAGLSVANDAGIAYYRAEPGSRNLVRLN